MLLRSGDHILAGTDVYGGTYRLYEALGRKGHFEVLFVDQTDEDALEIAAKNAGLNYIKLDGTIGCLVNGAGLAMATMDVIQLKGAKPANFLDIGGGANADVMAGALEVINNDPNVKAIFINIFGGITRGEEVAKGIVDCGITGKDYIFEAAMEKKVVAAHAFLMEDEALQREVALQQPQGRQRGADRGDPRPHLAQDQHQGRVGGDQLGHREGRDRRGGYGKESVCCEKCADPPEQTGPLLGRPPDV